MTELLIVERESRDERGEIWNARGCVQWPEPVEEYSASGSPLREQLGVESKK